MAEVIKEFQPKDISFVEHPEELCTMSKGLRFESKVSDFNPILASHMECKVIGDWKVATQTRDPLSSSLSSDSWTPEPEAPKIVLPATCTDVVLRTELVRPMSTSLGLDSICPALQLKHPELIPPPTSSDDVLPAEAPSPSSPPIDLTLSEFASTIKIDPKIQAIKAKMAIQTKVREESKSRISKAVKALQNIWMQRPQK